MTNVVEIYTEAHLNQLWQEYCDLVRLYWSTESNSLDRDLFHKMNRAHRHYWQAFTAWDNKQ